MIFQRRYIDGRDMMSDCLKPSWEPDDKFIITIISVKSWEEVVHYNDDTMVVTYKKTKELDRMVFNTDSKEVCGIWLLR